jgi:uncharacterized protein YfiM (DUF2279 family)
MRHLRRFILLACYALAAALAGGSALAHDDRHNPPVRPVDPLRLQPLDSWRSIDKRQHLGVSAVLGLASARAITDDTAHRGLRAMGCGVTCQRWLACMTPGTAKEAYDAIRRDGGGLGWSWKDEAANALGCALGLHIGGEF